jgi:polyphenol oxidase
VSGNRESKTGGQQAAVSGQGSGVSGQQTAVSRAVLKNMNFELRQNGQWSYFQWPGLENTSIMHAFFSRKSPSANMDSGERQRFLNAFSLKDLLVMGQEHGDTFHIIRHGERPLAGDALILLEKDVAAVIKTADCLPIIICEPDFSMGAIIHAGWRGTARRITEKVILAMAGLGANIDRMIALLGPCIGPCCYEVKEDVGSAFRNAGFSDQVFRQKDHTLYLDLRAANIEIMRTLGVRRIYPADLCTYCSRDLFVSYRKGETSHRQLNFVSLRG